MVLKTKPIDKEWLSRLKESGFTADSVFDKGQYEDLKSKLLYFGGEAVILPRIEPDKVAILERGTLYDGSTALIYKGKPCDCHANSAALASLGLGDIITTGYALSEDGIWRQHTWCMKDRQVIETTVKRLAYFGFELTEKESKVFIDNNF